MIKKFMAGVLLATLAVTAVAPAAASAHHRSSGQDTVQRLSQLNARTGAFDTLLAAATCTPVAGVLQSASGYTLFAPTDRAFRRAGLTPANVCDIPSEALTDILKYHVYAEGKVGYRQALRLRGNSIDMFNGDSAKLSGRWFRLRIDGQRVIWPNIRSSNAIIHVIAGVMSPPA